MWVCVVAPMVSDALEVDRVLKGGESPNMSVGIQLGSSETRDYVLNC